MDEGAVICDLAEYYHIYDWRALSVKYAATLVSGLSERSRTFKALAGVDFETDTVLLAAAVDFLALLWWARTKDGQKNRSRPKRIVDAMTKKKKKKTDLESFSSPERFKAARERILEEVKRNANRTGEGVCSDPADDTRDTGRA